MDAVPPLTIDGPATSRPGGEGSAFFRHPIVEGAAGAAGRDVGKGAKEPEEERGGERGGEAEGETAASWMKMDRGAAVDLRWREEVVKVLEDFTERTPGAYLELQESCVTWHYRDADPDFGLSQARGLHLHLDQVCARLPVRVSSSTAYKFLVVQPSRVGKGQALKHLLHTVQQHHAYGGDAAGGGSLPPSPGMLTPSSSPPMTARAAAMEGRRFDLVLSINDDRTDEDMFNIWRAKEQAQHLHGLFTVTCGASRTSRAK